jgi:hypothetical protein
MLVSRDQNAGQTREIKIGNRSFENVSHMNINTETEQSYITSKLSALNNSVALSPQANYTD